jgi:hypothetical protein
MTKIVDPFLDYVNEPIISFFLPSEAQQTLHLLHKGLSHYATEEHNHALFSEEYKTYKYILWPNPEPVKALGKMLGASESCGEE